MDNPFAHIADRLAALEAALTDLVEEVRELREQRPAGERLLSLDEAGALLGISARQVRNLCTKGDLKLLKVESSSKIRRSDVFEYIEYLAAKGEKKQEKPRFAGRRLGVSKKKASAR